MDRGTRWALLSMGSQRVRHDRATDTFHSHLLGWKPVVRKGQSTSSLLPLPLSSLHPQTVFFFLIINLFWLHEVFVAVCRLSLGTVNGGYSLLWSTVLGAWALVAAAPGLSSCSTRAYLL